MTIRDELYYKNRINKLSNNGKENNSVIKKLQRQLRNVENKEGRR